MRMSWGERWPAAAVLAAAAIMIVPLWVVHAPAMPDYPAHLASFYLIGGGIKDVAQFYRIEWGAIPNLAAEFSVPLLAKLTGLVSATKLFLSVGIALWVIGPALVQRALTGRVGLGALAGVVFAYNDNLMWGFFNYQFASGLCLALFAGWIATGAWRPLSRLAVFLPAVLIVYFAHVFAAATLLMLIGCHEAMKWWDAKPRTIGSALGRLWPIAVAFAPAFVLFFFVKPEGTDGHLAFNILETWQDRIEAILDRYFDNTYYALLAVYVLLFAAGLWWRRIAIERSMWLVLAALLIFSIVMPEEAVGGWGVDLRLPPVLFAMLFAASDIRLGERTKQILGVALMLLVVFNAAVLAGNWRYYDTRFDEFRAASNVIPKGSKIVTVLDGDSIGMASDQPYWHMAEFAVIDRSVFTPLLFTTRGQHVVRLQPGLEKIAATSARQGSPPDISELDDLSRGLIDGDTDIEFVFPYLMRFQCHYDDVVLIHLNGHRSPVPDMLRLVHAGSFFAIYKVVRTHCPST